MTTPFSLGKKDITIVFWPRFGRILGGLFEYFIYGPIRIIQASRPMVMEVGKEVGRWTLSVFFT